MTEPMSILELVRNAGPLVQAVMMILLLASVASWVMIFQRWFELNRVQREIDDFEEEFWSGIDLANLKAELDERPEDQTGIESLFAAGFGEYRRLAKRTWR